MNGEFVEEWNISLKFNERDVRGGVCAEEAGSDCVSVSIVAESEYFEVTVKIEDWFCCSVDGSCISVLFVWMLASSSFTWSSALRMENANKCDF